MPAGGLVEQIGAPHVADEDEIAGQYIAGFVRRRAVGHQEREVLGRMTGGMHRAQDDVADPYVVPVFEAFVRKAVLPLLAALVGEVKGRPGRSREFAGAGEVVGVDVGFGHGGNGHGVALGFVQIDLNVAPGIDDDGGAARLTADEVARLG